MRPKQLLLAIGCSVLLTLAILVLFEFFGHPKPPNPYKAVEITDEAGYKEANKEAEAFSSAVFPKVELSEPLDETDISNLTKAIRLYDGMLAYKPGNPLPGLTAGEAFLALNKNNHAIERFQQFLIEIKLLNDPRLHVARADAHYLLSKAYFNLHDYPTSLKEVNKALALYPNTATYLTQEASLYLQMNQPEKAVELAKKALKIDPSESHAKGIISLVGSANQKN